MSALLFSLSNVDIFVDFSDHVIILCKKISTFIYNTCAEAALIY